MLQEPQVPKAGLIRLTHDPHLLQATRHLDPTRMGDVGSAAIAYRMLAGFRGGAPAGADASARSDGKHVRHCMGEFMVRSSILGASLLTGLGAMGADAASIGFYTSASMPTFTEEYSLSQSVGDSGPATIDLERRIPNLENYRLRQFDPDIGTLERVDLYFGFASVPTASNRVSVALDDDCGGCEKDLSVDVVFGFGADILGMTQPGSGSIGQFFEISEQSFVEFGDFDNDPSTNFRPSAGDVALTEGSLDGQYSVRTFSDASDLAFFTGSGDVFFDVGAAVSLAAGLSCRDAALVQVSCSEALDLSIGGIDWALQLVYHYNTGLGAVLGNPTAPEDPSRIFGEISGFQILPPNSAPDALRFFDGTTPFTPEVIPLPAPALLLLSGFAALIGLRLRRA